MKTGFKGNRDRWLPIGMWNKVGEGGRRDYDHDKTKERNHRYDVALAAKTMNSRLVQFSKNQSVGGGMQEISSSGSGSGRVRRMMKVHYMKVAKYRRKGNLSGRKEEQNATQPGEANKEVGDSGYVNPKTPSPLFSVIIAIMDKFNTCETSEEEKGWCEFALHSAIYCDRQLG